jgi:integrase
MATTEHIGVSLWQKANGGNWYTHWRDPRDNRRKRNDSTETAHFDTATRIAMSLSRLINNRDFWEILPDGIHPQAEKIWGVRSLTGRVNQTRALLAQLQVSYEFLKENPPAGLSTQNDSAKWIEEALRLLKLLKEIAGERDTLAEENRRLKGIIQKISSRHLVKTEPKAYKDAVTDFFASPNGTSGSGQWREILRLWIDRFGREFGEQKDIHKVSTDSVIKHVSNLKKKNGKKVSGGTKLKLVNNLCMFLDHATSGLFDSKTVKDSIIPNLEEEDTEWFWLTKAQALGAIAELEKLPENGAFWADAATLQYACGFRPEELVLLRSKNVRIENGGAQIVVNRIFDGDKQGVRKLKTTRSQDAVQVPAFAMAALKRRMDADEFLLFPMYDTSLLPPIMQDRTKFEKKNGLWPTADEHQFSNCYRPRLRKAVKAFDASIEIKKVDARTLRRTCAREMILKHGYNQAAAVLRDSVETLRKHYADLQSSDISTER